VWSGEGVVAEGRKMLGATKPSDSLMGTIRGDFCIDIGRNVCHGSDCAEAAEAEIALWFPEGVASYDDHSAAWVYERPPASAKVAVPAAAVPAAAAAGATAPAADAQALAVHLRRFLVAAEVRRSDSTANTKRRADGNVDAALQQRAKGRLLLLGAAASDKEGNVLQARLLRGQAVACYEEGARRGRQVAASVAYGLATKGMLWAAGADAWIEQALCLNNAAQCHLSLADAAAKANKAAAAASNGVGGGTSKPPLKGVEGGHLKDAARAGAEAVEVIRRHVEVHAESGAPAWRTGNAAVASAQSEGRKGTPVPVGERLFRQRMAERGVTAAGAGEWLTKALFRSAKALYAQGDCAAAKALFAALPRAEQAKNRKWLQRVNAEAKRQREKLKKRMTSGGGLLGRKDAFGGGGSSSSDGGAGGASAAAAVAAGKSGRPATVKEAIAAAAAANAKTAAAAQAAEAAAAVVTGGAGTSGGVASKPKKVSRAARKRRSREQGAWYTETPVILAGVAAIALGGMMLAKR
jgi:hypothetical protein